MMKKVSAVVYSLLLATMADGFTSAPTSFVARTSPIPTIAHRAASMDSKTDEKEDQTSTDSDTTEEPLDPAAVWALQLESAEVQEVRAELVQKYLSLGRTQEYAEREVDEFLSDPERSQQFLEMRRYANAQAEELMGFEVWVQLFGAFALGLGGQSAFKYYHAYKSVYGPGEGPLPWLP
uniref:Uncharacterized protein n=1 Tax=Ditylum brightwellii TaxID=49249 RepID=A0A6U3RM51_9STRA|mmetsp:Transcript_23270/g.34684  ORF Transcript_23270/g.34684 Transcript_23270/m.34684 type:complete len:179 (+) Transcript_23270:73-609(+)